MESHPDRLIVLSTHRPAAFKLCDRIYRISGGKIAETTLEEAQSVNEHNTETKASSPRNALIPQLSMPMAPPENDPAKNNTDKGWWDT